jgi:hypothetical protein
MFLDIFNSLNLNTQQVTSFLSEGNNSPAAPAGRSLELWSAGLFEIVIIVVFKNIFVFKNILKKKFLKIFFSHQNNLKKKFILRKKNQIF